MKTKQRPTTVTAASAAVGSVEASSLRQRSREEEPARLRQRQPQQQCERERKHEAARKEREAQAQAQPKRPATTRRPNPTTKTTLASSVTRSLPKLSTCRPREQHARKTSKHNETLTRKAAASAPPDKKSSSVPSAQPAASSSGTDDEETAKLRLQLEHLAQLSQKDFEREFRKWMAQEGIEDKMHAHLRMDLINTFNSTALGKLLNRATASAAQLSQQQHGLLLSPIAMSLHTLVAEFLYEQNCHYTLSVFCSEMPHRHTLPDFESRTEFRFTEQELQLVLVAVLGDQQPADLAQLGKSVQQAYSSTQQSLLLALLKALVAKCEPSCTAGTQTTPTVCLQRSPGVDTSRLYPVEDLVVASDGQSVFIGPRVSQSLNGVEQQLFQLMQNMDALCKSCAPPVEVVSQQAFDQLVQQELLERQRLQTLGQALGPGETAIKLPDLTQQAEHGTAVSRKESSTVLSPVGPIKLPEESPSVPQLPLLHVEQVASLAMVKETLHKFQQQSEPSEQCQDRMFLTLDRFEELVGELAGCVLTLSNMLNLAMEQEYAVGRHKGFKLGYREGFSHGHYMGVQEGIQAQTKKQQEQQTRDAACQTQAKSSPRRHHSRSCQTEQLPRRETSTNTDSRRLRHVYTQTAPVPATATVECNTTQSRSYEQWIFEMLHSRSGKIFLERVELSLNKALEQQKHRLDELFEVKMRHHAEMLRLSRRHSSWRTLCRHVERDSHSAEARELVHKIFRLLEHYEAHHQLLAEKIQQTELAAEETARIQPVWDDTNDITRRPTAAPTPQARGFLNAASSYGPESSPSSVSVYVPAPAIKPAPSSAPAPAYAPAYIPIPVTAPAPAYVSAPASNPAAPAAPRTISAAAASAPEFAPVPPSAPPLLVPTSAPFVPTKPQMSSVGTNTYSPIRPTTSVAGPQSMSSLNEALLFAKNRMLHLEQESDLLEKSFLGYLERARAQKHKLNIRGNCARERQSIHRTLDNFREWQRRTRRDDVQLNPVIPPEASPIPSACEAEPESYHFTNAIALAKNKLFSELKATSHETAPATGSSALVAGDAVVSPDRLTPNEQLAQQLQSETDHLLSRVEATLARVPKPGSLQLLTAEAQLDATELEVDLLSSSTLTSLPATDRRYSIGGVGEGDGVGVGDLGNGERTPPASRKLQRSLARMNQLFGTSPSPVNTDVVPKPQTATRPWSAPTSSLNATCPGGSARAQRPHTAPISRTETPATAPAAKPNLLGLLDAFSDVGNTTANSNSLASSPDIHPAAMREVYAQLVNNASSGSHASSTPSPSLDFWQRMNL